MADCVHEWRQLWREVTANRDDGSVAGYVMSTQVVPSGYYCIHCRVETG